MADRMNSKATFPPGSRMPARSVCLVLSFILACFTQASAEESITSIRQIRELSLEQAKSGLPVHLNAVVTYSKRSIATLFVHDGTGGIFVEQQPGPDGKGPQSGDRVEITGITGEGMFAPVIKSAGPSGVTVNVISHGSPPEPRAVNGMELSGPNMDSEWVTIELWVKEVSISEGDLLLECAAGNIEFRVLLEGPLSAASVPWDLAESFVRVRGVAATTFNSSRQLTMRFIRVGELADITPMDHGSAPSADPRLVEANELLQFQGPAPDELVRIRGVCTLPLRGRGLFLKVDGGGLWVQTAQPVAASPGTVLDVVGWPRPGELKPFIRAKRVSVTGTSAAPAALHLNASEALHARHDGEWLSVDAELLDSFAGPEGTTLELHDADLVFRGLVPDAANSPISKLKPGSKLRIKGIARISPAGNFILKAEDKLMLLAGSVKDIEVLAPPPFWTARTVTIAAAIIIGLLISLYGIARARRRREQETQRREFEAVLAERGRFAREIHDSLAQGLTSISMQLECVRDRLSENPTEAAGHLEKARGFVRDSLREARRTVWNLRPLALGEADLAGTLQRHAADLSGSGRISFVQEIEGTPRPLQPEHEAALLRIGQEAMTNASRHSGATEVRHRLCFGNGWITLTVTDNGKGFDVATMAGRGFGLVGMHERVAALGGSLLIDSRPGDGTEVSATLPT